MGTSVPSERFESLPEEHQLILNHIGKMMGGDSVWFPGEREHVRQWVRRFKNTYVVANFKETTVSLGHAAGHKIVIDLMDPNCFAQLERALKQLPAGRRRY